MPNAKPLISPLVTNSETAPTVDAKRMHDALILVVDDVKLNLKMITTTLQARGYTNIVQAQNGLEALDISRRLRPDLVILDLMMPEMDGFAYCKAIRKDSSFSSMPIIVQTALDEMEHKLSAFKEGASDYICKPVDGRELEARVQVHLVNKFLMQDVCASNQRILQEMEAAKAMQNRLMPSEHQLKMCERVFDLKIASYFETSSTLGGDCWGMRPISDSKLAIYMYDFSGHGISAAMNIFRMHTIMREFNHASGDPGNFVTMLNRHLHPLLERTEFATMFYGIIDIEANCLLYATAGVPSPVLCANADKTVMGLNGRGFPLGVIPHATYETQYTAFLPGDLLVFFSDCLIETRDSKGDFITDTQIMDTIHNAWTKNGEQTAQDAIDALKNLLGSHSLLPLIDDITINAYSRKPS